jgi:hypothetical protein
LGFFCLLVSCALELLLLLLFSTLVLQLQQEQATIAHHGIVPNNPNMVPTSLNLSPQQFITTTANIPPTVDAPTFANPMGEFFRILELEFPIKSSEKIMWFAIFFSIKR